MASIHQDNVTHYHAAVSDPAHHGGHNMHLIHREWHRQNRDPLPPNRPDPNWGVNLVFGTNFLQMHHEMVKALPNEQHFHMFHESVAYWYQEQGLNLPITWNSLSPIPPDLGYEPDPTTFPDEIIRVLEQWASSEGVSIEQLLTRSTNEPAFELPKYFTREGIAPGESGELFTGARKLADFKNSNQLGCCLVFPHNEWHGIIGGAMGSTLTAIADPIFYFGIHWHIDRIFDEYKIIQEQQRIHALDRDKLLELKVFKPEIPEVQLEFTDQQRILINKQREQSHNLHKWTLID
jgi:hypothetical protein